MKLGIAALVALAAIGVLAARAGGYPTSCNAIPTADILSPGMMRIEFENAGWPRIGGDGSESYSLMQIGLTPRLEFGVDRWDIFGQPQDSTNAKCLLLEESDRGPAVALGVMDLGEGSSPSYYGIATRTSRRLRLHAGYIRAEYSHGPLLGLDYELAARTYFLADWMRGTENYLTLGLYREIGKRWAVTLSFGLPNESSAGRSTTINLSYCLPFAPRVAPAGEEGEQ